MATKTTTKENKEKDESLYNVKVTMNDQIYETEAKDLKEAILSLNPTMIKTKVLFEIGFKDKMFRQVALIQQARRIFTRGTDAEYFAIRVSKALNI